MNAPRIGSDQLSTWSARDAKHTRFRFAQTPPISAAPTAPARGHPARLADRALQTLWQARVQMRERSRSWSQVLSVGELPGTTPTNGLRTAGELRPDHRVPRQLPPSPRDLRGDLRHQPRTATPPRGALGVSGERGAATAHPRNRYAVGRRAHRQYAHQLARSGVIPFSHRGGSR
jgi:hypothetical protein